MMHISGGQRRWQDAANDLLNSHSQICAPHETHFRRLQVTITTPPTGQAMAAADLLVSDLT